MGSKLVAQPHLDPLGEGEEGAALLLAIRDTLLLPAVRWCKAP